MINATGWIAGFGMASWGYAHDGENMISAYQIMYSLRRKSVISIEIDLRNCSRFQASSSWLIRYFSPLRIMADKNQEIGGIHFPFPFTPYSIQKDFMAVLYQVLENGKIGIFESPTGTVSMNSWPKRALGRP